MEFYRHRSYRPFWKWDTPCLFGETRHLLCVWISALLGNINLSMQPRTCREFLLTCNHVGLFVDTTPHMRGILFQKCVQLVFARYSPAHAGNPHSSRWLIFSASIQPRTCGGSHSFMCRILSTLDTAPHMRGIPSHQNVQVLNHRYNPAHAGNPFACFFMLLALRYNPAHAGNPMAFQPEHVGREIQPRTCGDSLSGVCTACVCAIQPRTCGESHSFMCRILSTLDTAPHMRGI